MSQPVRAAIAVESKRAELREFEWPSIPADWGPLSMDVTGNCGSNWPNCLNSSEFNGPLNRGHNCDAVELAMQIIADGCYPLKVMYLHQFAPAGVGTVFLTLGGEGTAIHCSVKRWQ